MITIHVVVIQETFIYFPPLFIRIVFCVIRAIIYESLTILYAVLR